MTRTSPERSAVHRAQRHILVGFAFGLVALAGCSHSSATFDESPSTPAVHSIVDGDTILVEFGLRDPEPVRLLGIDTPETVDPSRPVQCFGAEATARLRELIPPGTEIVVEIDGEPRDQYGRLLGYVYRASDDLFVNRALLEGGFADLSIYEPNTTHESELRNAMLSARTAATGLWSVCGGPDVPIDPPAVDEQRVG